MPMMPNPMSSEDRIRRLMGGLPSMPPTHIEPTPDIDVGPMQDFSPQAASGFEFDNQPMGEVPQAAPKAGSGNPGYDQMMQGRRDQHAQMMQGRRDAYAADMQARRNAAMGYRR